MRALEEDMALSAEFVLAVILPDTGPVGARVVECRVREMLPGAEVGLATREPDD